MRHPRSVREMTAVSDSATSTPSRGRLGTFRDRTLTRLLRLPPPTTEYSVHTVRVPMRDGVELLTDHYEPATPHPTGTLLVRCPYGRGFPFSSMFSFIRDGKPRVLAEVKHEAVVTFLALLEMAKLRLIAITQPEGEPEIIIERASDDLRARVEATVAGSDEYR